MWEKKSHSLNSDGIFKKSVGFLKEQNVLYLILILGFFKGFMGITWVEEMLEYLETERKNILKHLFEGYK